MNVVLVQRMNKTYANVQNEMDKTFQINHRGFEDIFAVDRKSLTRKLPLLLQLGCKYELRRQPHRITGWKNLAAFRRGQKWP